MSRVLPPLRIGQHIVRSPIVQGALAVQVSGAKLAGAVANAGGVGMIASLGLGLHSRYFDPRKRARYYEVNRLALSEELVKARTISPEGVLGVNVLVATRDFPTIAETAAVWGANIIVASAGLPLSLPEYTANHPEVALVPVVSNLQSAQIICQFWQQNYNRLPDAFIVENCKQIGGHFTQCDQINPTTFSVESLLTELRHYLEQEIGIQIPLILTGGIWDSGDIDQALAMGADGVQIGSRFITTEECDAAPRYKEFHLRSAATDIVTVPSPIGKLGRALRNSFTEAAIADSPTLERRCIANCLENCLCRDTGQTYCMLQALSRAAQGDVENGLIFASGNIKPGERLLPVSELMAELINSK